MTRYTMRSSEALSYGKRFSSSDAVGRFMLRISIVFALLAVSIAREAGAGELQTLPFSTSVTTSPLEMLRGNIDYPIAHVVVRGEVWLIFVPGGRAYEAVCPVYRYKGPDLEHLTRLPDGVIRPPVAPPGDGRSCHFGCGMWYDEATGTLYGLAHNEYEHRIDRGNAANGAGWCRKKTHVSTSTDMGLTWTVVGDVLAASLAQPDDWTKYSGSEFEAGPADFDFYADTRGGYFYVTSWNAFVPKQNTINGFHMYSEVARCAIADKMAPGKWYKYNNGAWTEPGIGGKASRVGMNKRGLYGGTIYSDYLKKYLRIGCVVGCVDDRGMPPYGLHDSSICISTCTDLAKQDWTPITKLLDEPKNRIFGVSLADSERNTCETCGRLLKVYNYWIDGSRTLNVKFNAGAARTLSFPTYDSYSYEPHPEAGDRMESRKTKITGCANSDMRYAGDGWRVENDEHYYQGRVKQCGAAGNSVEFSFQGSEIYWRAVASKDGGKADVYLDDQPATTVDCYFWNSPLAYQFAFVKTGLDPKTPHTIKIVVRGDKNANSSGTIIRHMAFEHSAESYRASAGFCSVSGKNRWYYQLRNQSTERDLTFTGVRDKAMLNYWSDGAKCMIGGTYQIADGTNAAVRKWVAPHDGRIRVEGEVALETAAGDGVRVEILKNVAAVWPSQLVTHGKAESHDMTISVTKGDSIRFVVKRSGDKPAGKAIWDPVITYVDASGTTN
jgi:hypothetical protein